mmetsp:Transcript_29372/g.32519  ORF Transcript_29372/g.32519 Transcript_29372/m.32519 type:complete len:222 (+) Transcript_29372:52-717(+)
MKQLLLPFIALLLFSLTDTMQSLLIKSIHPAPRSIMVHQRAAVTTTTTTLSSSKGADDSQRLFPEELNILYDSKCNVCKLEIDFLRKRDQKLNTGSPKLKFTDLEDSGYNNDDAANGFINYEIGMQAMHAVRPNGSVLTGVPVFSEAYKQVGLGWLFGITRVPILNWLADRGYDLFAKYRTNITRGQSVDTLIQAYWSKRSLLEKQREDCSSCEEKKIGQL